MAPRKAKAQPAVKKTAPKGKKIKLQLTRPEGEPTDEELYRASVDLLNALRAQAGLPPWKE